jgi:hypothetical protein
MPFVTIYSRLRPGIDSTMRSAPMCSRGSCRGAVWMHSIGKVAKMSIARPQLREFVIVFWAALWRKQQLARVLISAVSSARAAFGICASLAQTRHCSVDSASLCLSVSNCPYIPRPNFAVNNKPRKRILPTFAARGV